MIRHIKLHGVATYTEPVDIDLKDINFFYGGNGAGKTTISNLISGDLVSPTCVVDMNNSENETILVYNKPFVDRSFREVGDITGIFTLGRDASEDQEFIRVKAEEYGIITEQIEGKGNTLEKLGKENRALETKFQEDCWQVQTKYGVVFPKTMTGTRASKNAFSKKCLETYDALDESVVKTIEELKVLYHAAFSKEAAQYEQYIILDLEKAVKLDNNALLSKRITGKVDSDIGRFIEYLGASDWVKRGTILAEKADGKCPYCSQLLPENVKSDIENFFHETYQKECSELKSYAVAYGQFCEVIIDQLNSIVMSRYDIFSYDELSTKVEVYKARVEKNKTLLGNKIESPSLSVIIEQCVDLLAEINEIIIAFNKKIVENNNLVEHQKDTQKNCEDEVWRFIVTELLSVIRDFKRQSGGKKRAIENVKAKQTELVRKASEIKAEIKEKRASISSVQYTVLAINRILEGYGFNGFKLAENESTCGTYKIVRPDGTDAKASLSEGEYNFITFLYFYHLVFGSRNPEEMNRNKVIVIDDPISSLDSNVLFIVSSLVKNIITFCRNGEHSIKQVLISTHNIYFHKEITFVGSRGHWPAARTAFFIVRKKNEVSSITEYAENQIQSSYEMLWDEVRQPSNGTAKSIFNTMRRILENYFNIIGGIDYEKCVNEFDGEEKVICKSLISCINEQSHMISDDYFMCVQDSEIDQYIQIFRDIFEKMNHISHYNMMMGIEADEHETNDGSTESVIHNQTVDVLVATA
ncbi:MAG: ATP-binding protein [Erysipelotrichia bacterium]|nr:ATP-binding protein [Erysipelotrichia bacterium]